MKTPGPFHVRPAARSIPAPGITLHLAFADATGEGYGYAQPDPDHLVLSGPSGSLSFTREQVPPAARSAYRSLR